MLFECLSYRESIQPELSEIARDARWHKRHAGVTGKPLTRKMECE